MHPKVFHLYIVFSILVNYNKLIHAHPQIQILLLNQTYRII